LIRERDSGRDFRRSGEASLAAEVLSRHVPQPPPTYRVPRFVGKGHSGRHDLSERVEEILSSELGT